jgi:hypothetical protein
MVCVFISPMLLQKVDEPFDNDEYLSELKTGWNKADAFIV